MNETEDERYFINWFNQLASGESIRYVTLDNKERYLKTSFLAKRFKPAISIDVVKGIYSRHWKKLKKSS